MTAHDLSPCLRSHKCEYAYATQLLRIRRKRITYVLRLRYVNFILTATVTKGTIVHGSLCFNNADCPLNVLSLYRHCSYFSSVYHEIDVIYHSSDLVME